MTLKRCLAALAFAALCLTRPAAAQFAPDRPVRIVVPVPPGGAVDVAARIVGQKLSELWKQPVTIDNITGASGNVGADVVARAPADGYTLLISAPTVFSINKFLYKNMAFDPDTAFKPVSIAVVTPNILVINPAYPAKTLKELIDLARQKPGDVQYASQGIGSTSHLTGALMGQTAGVDFGHVPYRGDAPALNDVVAGHVPFMWNSIGSVLSFIRAGTLRALAVGTSERLPELPDTPTAKEAGLDIESVTYIAFAAPAGTPDAIVGSISKTIADALHDPNVRARFADMGARAVGDTPAEMRAYVAAETAKWRQVIARAGIALQ